MDTNFIEMLKAEKEADQGIITSLEKKVYDMRNLIEIGISLSSNLEFQSLVESILYSCIGQLFIEKIAILLQVDIDINSYYIHSHKGYDSGRISSDVVLDEGAALVEFLRENPVPHEFKRLVDTPALNDDLNALENLSPVLLVPMRARDDLNGIIVVGKKMMGSDFDRNEKEFLRNLARFAATAVENSRLYLMATQDRMTRLYIHHYFQERLSEEIKRSQRHATPLSLLMTDIDHFKKFNDSYGHQQGDIVIKHTANLMKKSVRSLDIAARYGGEEFAVILPDTSAKEAAKLAQRLRKSIEVYEFPGQEEPLHVTISIGVAQYDPLRDSSKQDFIERADMALYHAKDSGRNRVGLFK